MAKAMDVADAIIMAALNLEHPISNLQLQKTMYFLNVIHLLDQKASLINDGTFEKWDYGPVMPSVYREYSFNGGNVIEKPIRHVIIRKEGDSYVSEKMAFDYDKFKKNNPDDAEFIANNIAKFIFKNPFDLVDKSHEETQWKNKINPYYDDAKTISYYRKLKNRFWENHENG